MQFSTQLVDCFGLVPGLCDPETLSAWAQAPLKPIDPKGALVFDKRVPMMTARRMSPGMRLACECALALLERGSVDAFVFSSRHGELARAEKLVTQVAQAAPLSPTDFMMSVHNAAVGMLTIQQKSQARASSVAAGADSFHNALVEVKTLLASGAKRVMLVDFESELPPMIGGAFSTPLPSFPYAVASVWASGETLEMMFNFGASHGEPAVPSAIAFWHGWQSGAQAFQSVGSLSDVRYCRKGAQ